MPRRNFYISQTANSAGLVKLGLIKAVEEAAIAKSAEVWLVVNTLQVVTNGIIGSAIGEDAARALKAGKPVKLGQSQLVAKTERTLPFGFVPYPILAIYPTEKLLTKIDGFDGVPSLIVLPWLTSEIETWVQAHGPIDLLGKAHTQKSSVQNPVVEQALDTIWTLINVGTGIGHQSDKATVIDVFRKLRAARETYTSAEVRAWLVQKGMDPRHADEIAKIADDPSRFKSNSNVVVRNDILTLWRERAKGENSE